MQDSSLQPDVPPSVLQLRLRRPILLALFEHFQKCSVGSTRTFPAFIGELLESSAAEFRSVKFREEKQTRPFIAPKQTNEIHRSKLTLEQEAEIVELLSEGLGKSAIAQRFGVGLTTIIRALRRVRRREASGD